MIANIIEKYDVIYGDDFDFENFDEAIKSYLDDKGDDVDDELCFYAPETTAGLYEYNRYAFNDFVDWADVHIDNEKLLEFIHKLKNANPESDYVRIEVY